LNRFFYPGASHGYAPLQWQVCICYQIIHNHQNADVRLTNGVIMLPWY